MWTERVLDRGKSPKAQRQHVVVKKQNKTSVARKRGEGKADFNKTAHIFRSHLIQGLEELWDFFSKIIKSHYWRDKH